MIALNFLALRFILPLVFAGCSFAKPPQTREVIRQSFGMVTVIVGTTEVPPNFGGSQSMIMPGYGDVNQLIVNFDLRVNGKPVSMPFDAFAGLGDPIGIVIRKSKSSQGWNLTLTGGDASTSYCAVMRFDAVQVRTINLFRRCTDKVPFATKRYTTRAVLD